MAEEFHSHSEGTVGVPPIYTNDTDFTMIDGEQVRVVSSPDRWMSQ